MGKGVAIKAKITGVESLQQKLQALPKDAKLTMQQSLIETGLLIQNRARRSIQKSPADPDTGRSIPGNPPKTDTGRLVNSIFVDTKEDGDRTTVTVGTILEYGKHLEFGTKSILARPWLFPALEGTKKEAKKSLIGLLSALFKKGGRK